jgi:anti-anti-sigma regulatory factor
MKITLTQSQEPASVAILHLDGVLDGSNQETLVIEARKLYAAGVRDLVLDLSRLTFISSAGLGALHLVALLFRGAKRPAKNESWDSYRWAAYRGVRRNDTGGMQRHVKLFSPTKEVRHVLDLIGFNSIFEIYTDLNQATASFHNSGQLVESSR